jgi:molybdenum cofactor cytidylyltransferase
MVTAIVLAAGTSQRMGGINKLVLDYKGRTVLETTLANILASDLDEVIVVTGHESGKVTGAIHHLPVRVIHNNNYSKGMTTSIQSGIEHAKESGYMICLGDMCSITPEEYSLLKEAFEKNFPFNSKHIYVPRYHKAKGNPVIFSPYYKDAILEHQEMDGCKAIVQANKENIFWIDMPGDHILQDMDYYEDYERLLKTD